MSLESWLLVIVALLGILVLVLVVLAVAAYVLLIRVGLQLIKEDWPTAPPDPYRRAMRGVRDAGRH